MTPAVPPRRISAVISDVDGTLLNEDKVLTERARRAVAALGAAGIAFALVSSRPPRGLRMLFEPLRIAAPVAGFNGGLVATPGLSALERHPLSPAAVRRAIALLADRGVETWVFGERDWFVRDPEGTRVGHEQRTIGFAPVVVGHFTPDLGAVYKIVGVSNDFALLDRCETDARAILARDSSVSRSQPYYLDMTHPLANKGEAVLALSKLLEIPNAEIAVIGDGDNDVPMFERSGLSIAMGNASLNVQRAANLLTASHREEGFASAMERFILTRERTAQTQRTGIRERLEDRR